MRTPLITSSSSFLGFLMVSHRTLTSLAGYLSLGRLCCLIFERRNSEFSKINTIHAKMRHVRTAIPTGRCCQSNSGYETESVQPFYSRRLADRRQLSVLPTALACHLPRMRHECGRHTQPTGTGWLGQCYTRPLISREVWGCAT